MVREACRMSKAEKQAGVRAEVASLHSMTLAELRNLWEARFGAPPKQRSVDLLRRVLAWRDLQTLLWLSFDVRLPLRWQIAQNINVELFYLSILTKKQLQAEVDQQEYDAKFMKMLAGASDKWDKDSYKVANSIMKPLLQLKGYRSLAEFEDAYAKEGQNLAWPKDGGTLPLNPAPLR
jgi:hypothetical protein